MSHRIQRRRAAALLDERGVDGALFASPASVTWLTGFAPPVQTGPSPFRGQPAYVWYCDGYFTCLVQDAHAQELTELLSESDVRVAPYTGYTLERPITIGTNVADVLADVLADAPSGRVAGIELEHAPARLADLVRGAAERNAPIGGWLEPLRMVKTDDEIAKLRDAFALADEGHVAARRAVRAGAREIDVWTEIHGAVERRAGRRVPMGNDCVSGRREANVGGWPETVELREGDAVIVDLGAAPSGYWSDSCATYPVGAPGPQLREIHGVVSRALEHAVSLVRPGVRANEIDRSLRTFMEASGYPVFPHHSGHGVGVTAHEAPRLAPHDDTPLEPGMVVMVEPGIYLPGRVGVRLEDGLLVTDDGCERLTSHDAGLD